MRLQNEANLTVIATKDESVIFTQRKCKNDGYEYVKKWSHDEANVKVWVTWRWIVMKQMWN